MKGAQAWWGTRVGPTRTYRDRYLYRGGTLTRADRIGQTDLAVPDLVVPVEGSASGEKMT